MSMSYSRQHKFTLGTKCSVDTCDNEAEYEVILYDFYDHMNETFYEQDYTCPFICRRHMQENEERAKGERKPRGYVVYPYSNRHRALGYSKYSPIKEIYPQLFEDSIIEDNEELQIDLKEINEALISYLAQHPEYILQLDPRKFEELIAALFRNKGYDITLTPSTKDGGKDIVGIYKSPFGHQMFIVECKKYSPQNKVGVEIVRGLYGVKVAGNYNQAIIATTSTFTKGAKDFIQPLKFQMELKDMNDIKNWINEYKK